VVPLSGNDLLLAGGAACIASVAGFVALPVPSGIGVREAVLVADSGYEPGHVQVVRMHGHLEAEDRRRHVLHFEPITRLSLINENPTGDLIAGRMGSRWSANESSLIRVSVNTGLGLQSGSTRPTSLWPAHRPRVSTIDGNPTKRQRLDDNMLASNCFSTRTEGRGAPRTGFSR